MKKRSIARIRVVVVDDDEDTRLYFHDILQSSLRFEFVGGFANAKEALAGMSALEPDLTLMDVRLPDLNGIECARRLKKKLPRLKIVMVTGTHEPKWVDHSAQAGALSFLVKPVAGEQLLATLKGVAGIPAKTKRTSPSAINDAVSGRLAKFHLNTREMQILKGLTEGLLYKEIADKLGLSCSAVHKTQHIVYRKLHVTNRSEAIRLLLLK